MTRVATDCSTSLLKFPPGLALVTVGADGALTVRIGLRRPVVRGATVQVDVVVDSAAGRDLVVVVDGVEVPVPAGGAGLRTVDATGPVPVTCEAARCTVDAVVPTAAATLRLASPHGARWSVTDATGAWSFAGALQPGTYRVRCAPGHGLAPGVSTSLVVE